MKINKYTLEDLDFIQIKNDSNMEVILTPFGASIYCIKINEKYMTLTPKNIKDFKLNSIYHGKTVGRFANRISNGEITINNKKYILEKNENNNTLHGGFHGLSTATFNTSINEEINKTIVTFTYNSPNLEAGFPGVLTINIIYSIYKNENIIRVDYNCTADQETPVVITNHSYFCLGNDNILDCDLFINGNKYIETDDKELLPIRVSTVPYYLDFSKHLTIGKYLYLPVLQDHRAHGYDHHIFFNNSDLEKPQVILKNNKYALEIYTNFKGTQIYSDNFSDDVEFFGTHNNKNRAVAIEPQNGFHNLHLLKPSETYSYYSIYKFLNF